VRLATEGRMASADPSTENQKEKRAWLLQQALWRLRNWHSWCLDCVRPCSYGCLISAETTARLAVEGFVLVAELAQAVQRLHHGALHLGRRLLGREAVAVDAAGALPLHALHAGFRTAKPRWQQVRWTGRCGGGASGCGAGS
jgi:hypothetical protein